MAVYEVFSTCVAYKFRSTICSKSTIFLLVVSILTILLPLLIAYRSRGFWLKTSMYREQPNIHYEHNYILHMETNQPHQPIICTSYRNLSKMTKPFNKCTLVKAREADNNKDGINDELFFEAQVTVLPPVSVRSVQLFLLLDYKLEKQCLVHMESLAYITHHSAYSGYKLNVMGDVHFIQKEQLKCRGRDTRFYQPSFNYNTYQPHDYDTLNILTGYSKRNLSTNLENVYTVWSRGTPTEGEFSISVNLQYTEATIFYTPNFWQVIKWAWIQYVSILLIFVVLFRYIKHYVFTNMLVPTVQEVPWKKGF